MATRLFVVSTRNKRPILSERISAFQWVKWPYLDKILDTFDKVSQWCQAVNAFGTWTENPRVGGSIPPLATILTTLSGSDLPAFCRPKHLWRWPQE